MVEFKKVPNLPQIKSPVTPEAKDITVQTPVIPDSSPADNQKGKEMAKLPTEFGKKMAEQRVLYEPLAQRQLFQSRQQLSPEARGLLTKAFQSILKEPFLQQRRGSDLAQFVEERFSELARGTSTGFKKIPLEMLQRLFQVRNRAEDKSQVFTVLRFEIAKLKEERAHEKERVSELKNRSEDPNSKGRAGGAEKSAQQLEKEAFLKRASHNLKNLNPDESESTFEALLKKVLAGSESAPDTPEGKKAQFKGKSNEEWLQFFKNVLANGSEESAQMQKADQILDAFYRGLYKNLSSQKGMTLITDLNLLAGEKEISEKFARIVIENPDLIEKLTKLKPGDDVPKELLKLIGDQVSYTKLVNKIPVPDTQSGQQLLAQLRQQINPQSFSRLEKQLLEERKKLSDQNKRDFMMGGWLGQGDNSLKQPNQYLGHDWEEKNRIKGDSPKLMIFMAYSMVFFFVTLLLYLFFRASY